MLAELRMSRFGLRGRAHLRAAREVRVEPVDLLDAGGLGGRLDVLRPRGERRVGRRITDQEREVARLLQQPLEAVVGDRLDDRVGVRGRQTRARAAGTSRGCTWWWSRCASARVGGAASGTIAAAAVRAAATTASNGGKRSLVSLLLCVGGGLGVLRGAALARGRTAWLRISPKARVKKPSGDQRDEDSDAGEAGVAVPEREARGLAGQLEVGLGHLTGRGRVDGGAASAAAGAGRVGRGRGRRSRRRRRRRRGVRRDRAVGGGGRRRVGARAGVARGRGARRRAAGRGTRRARAAGAADVDEPDDELDEEEPDDEEELPPPELEEEEPPPTSSFVDPDLVERSWWSSCLSRSWWSEWSSSGSAPTGCSARRGFASASWAASCVLFCAAGVCVAVLVGAAVGVGVGVGFAAALDPVVVGADPRPLGPVGGLEQLAVAVVVLDLVVREVVLRRSGSACRPRRRSRAACPARRCTSGRRS